MKKLIWKLRFAWYMRSRVADCSWCFAWQTAETQIKSDPDWHEYSPKESCDEELSCWTAD